LDVAIPIAANDITIAVPISVEEAPIAVVQLIALRKAIVELRPASLGRVHRLASVGGPRIAWSHIARPHSPGSAWSARRTGVTGAGTASAAWSVCCTEIRARRSSSSSAHVILSIGGGRQNERHRGRQC